tara:strand:+ start:59 stop:229 length:171 start_codon:yes stop_codon:yes gene_type:complete
MKKLFLFLFLVSCSSTNLNLKAKDEILNFNKDLTFNEFNELLIRYAEISSYPNIDQ